MKIRCLFNHIPAVSERETNQNREREVGNLTPAVRWVLQIFDANINTSFSHPLLSVTWVTSLHTTKRSVTELEHQDPIEPFIIGWIIGRRQNSFDNRD